MSYTQKPRMILFDVGGTLFNDGLCNAQAGFEKLVGYAENPEAGDPVRMAQLWEKLIGEVTSRTTIISGYGVDMPLYSILKYAGMNCGLKFSISPAQQEELFDRFNSTRELTPGIGKLLQDLNEMGIRTAVISNNMMSGESLAMAIEHWLPEAKMEFCLTSADLQLCKPWGGLFETAAAFAGVDTADCWYCGDGRIPDVDGARNGGMTPVLYDAKSDIPMEFRTDGNRGAYMTVNHWDELGEFLKKL